MLCLYLPNYYSERGETLPDGESKSGAEKRRYPRANIMLKVQYRHAKDFLADYTENISAGGVFIATEERFEQGTKLDFEVSFPGLLDSIPLKGLVKWCRPARSPEEPAGIGIQFEQEQAISQGPLAQLVTKLKNSQSAQPTDAPVVFRVLLVEDNVVVRDMFRYGIQKLTTRKKFPGTSLEVEEAENGKQAWDMLKRQSFHLLVLDLYMPVMDGSKLIEHIRSDEKLKEIPIIVVSSGGREDRERALAAGADLFLSKPIKLKEMVETIESLIATNRPSAT
jgi:two-component system chemotaxis response regulator CheY